MQRRDFLKVLGLTAGVSLVGCEGTDDAVIGQGLKGFANSYKFVPLTSSGATLPNRKAILAQAAGEDLPFLGAVMINDKRRVCFHATNDSGKLGVHGVHYDQNGPTDALETIVEEGDVLPGGMVVDDLSGGYLNNADDFVVVVSDADGKEACYYSNGGAALERLFQSYDDLSGQCRLYGDLHSDVGLTDDGDMLFACNFRDADDAARGEGLFYVPRESTAVAQLLLAENQLLPGTTCALKTFGLCEIGRGGDYLVQGTAAPVEAELNPDGSTPTYLVRGAIGEDPQILVADPALGIEGALQGSVHMGPRLGPDGAIGFVLQTEGERTQLWINQTKILDAAPDGTGSVTPRGGKVLTMFPPVFGPHGLVLVQVFTHQGTELLAYNGGLIATLLARGDLLEGGKQVEMFLFGCLPHCVNAHGEFALVVEYTGGESAILLGIPV